MNILVTGGNGQLGNSLKTIIRDTPSDNYFFTDIDTLDITDRNAVRKMIRDTKADVIVNCAAYTNVDLAEDNYPAAEILNASAPGILAEEISACEGHIIHISTDYVFGGDIVNTPLDEETPLNPLGVYGITKRDGEEKVRKAAEKNHTVIRTAWLYSEYGKNFLKTILNLLDTKKSINVVYDQVGSPTYARDLAMSVVNIISTRRYRSNPGTYHFSDAGVCSWFDFAKAISEISGKRDCSISPCLSSEYPSNVKRPPYSVLSKKKISGTFGIDIPYWRDSLRICVNNIIKSDNIR